MIDLLDFIRPLVLAQQALFVNMVPSATVPCAGGCGTFLPRIPADTTDLAIRARGRQCHACYERHERERAHE